LAEQFSDLIDSMLNMRDEGFYRTADYGFKVAQLSEGKLISFFKNTVMESPIWSLKMDLKNGSHKLFYLNKKNESIMTLDPDGRVGINEDAPDFELDVKGAIASDGRIGRQVEAENKIKANGEWHPIREKLMGCHAYEIMAGVGKQGHGKYALLHAFTLKTFGSKGKITYHQAHYGSRCNRLKLRWFRPSKNSDAYQLEIRTNCCYGDGIYINCFVTELWFDHFMKDCK
jgi:hypothetical protein